MTNGIGVMQTTECTVCGSNLNTSLTATLFTSDTVDIDICSGCGMARRRHTHDLHELHSIQLDVAEESLSEINQHDLKWPSRFNLLARVVKRMVAPGSSVLDVGCGNGTWLTVLGKNYKKYGIELSRSSAEMAERASNAEIYIGPYEEYPNVIEFDLITAFAVIEHLSDPVLFVQWASARLMPGGLLIIMTADRESGVARRMGSMWPLYASPEHFSYFSARALRKLLNDNGFISVREEWRFMSYDGWQDGWQLFLLRPLMKFLEILGLTSSEYNDHYYCYARKA